LTDVGLVKKVCIGDSSDHCKEGFVPTVAITQHVPNLTYTNRLSVPCGTRSLGEITSITTEGKTAVVKYNRIKNYKLQDVNNTIPACALNTTEASKEEGTIEVTATFKQDDNGNWIDNEK